MKEKDSITNNTFLVFYYYKKYYLAFGLGMDFVYFLSFLNSCFNTAIL